jgi:hypothetical protein
MENPLIVCKIVITSLFSYMSKQTTNLMQLVYGKSSKNLTSDISELQESSDDDSEDDEF